MHTSEWAESDVRDYSVVFMHVRINYGCQSCYIFRPKYLGAVLRTDFSKCLKWLLYDGFALQFVISLKSTRTGKDCMSNALENTSIKNWLIQWNRAEPGKKGRQTVWESHRGALMCCLQRREEGLRRKKGSLSNYFQRLKTVSPSWRMYSVKKMIETAPYDLEL